MDMNIITTAASEAVLNVTLAAIALAAAYAVYYIRLAATKVKKQTQQIEDETARALLDNALYDVERLATKAVSYTEQTVAKKIREAVKAGTCDREKLLSLGRDVFNEVKGEIGPETQEIIVKNLGSFDHYLEQCIEDAVRKVKQEEPYITIPEGALLDGVDVSAVNEDATAQ